MKDKNSSESRRKLLKSIALGSGAVVAGKSLPESWSRPVVDSVMLPAHAQTSGLIYGGTALMAALDSDDQSLMAQVMDSLVPEVEAADGQYGWYTCCIVAGDMVDVTLAGLNWCNGGKAGIIRQALIPMDGNPHTISATAWATGDCNNGFPTDGQKLATVSVAPESVGPGQLTLTVHPKWDDSFNLTVQARTSCLPLPVLYDCDNDNDC